MPLKRLIITALTVITLVLSLQVQAQALDHRRIQLAAQGDIPWQSLSPEEQRALQRYRGDWDSYSRERQRDMRKGVSRYLDLPPHKRQQLEQQRQQYQQLSPQERKRLREEYKRQKR